MRLKELIIIIVLILVAVFVWYLYKNEFNNADNKVNNELNSLDESITIDRNKNNKENTRVNISIDGKTFVAVLENSDTTTDFIKMLPLDIEMTELNGNEKYYKLSSTIKSSPKNVNKIMAGDIMLWNDDTIVLFYKGFDTTYQYTKIGHIENVDGLVDTVKDGNINVKFEVVK